MKERASWKKVLVASVLLLIAVAVAVPVAAFRLAKHDLTQKAQTIEPGRRVSVYDFEMHASFRHMLWVSCKAENRRGISTMYWRLLPWREMEGEK